MRYGGDMASRIVHCADALEWLGAAPHLEGASFITSLPDWSEFPTLSLAEWRRWFQGAVQLVLSRCADDGVALFFQSDIKVEGEWVDKGYLCQRAAEEEGHRQLMHRVICRRTPGTVTFGRPAWSHLLAFSKGVRLDPARSEADVLPAAGESTWVRGMGLEACAMACRFVREQTRSTRIIDPFCGHGTVLAVAELMGFDAVGVELSPKRARRAKALRVERAEDGHVLRFAASPGATTPTEQ